MVITSTLAYFYSALCAAIFTLRGKLHEGANEAALDVILKFNNIENPKVGIKKCSPRKI